MSQVDIVSSEFQDWQRTMDTVASLEASLEISDKEKTIQLLALIARGIADLNYHTLSMKEMLQKISLKNQTQESDSSGIGV